MCCQWRARVPARTRASQSWISWSIYIKWHYIQIWMV
jgi:hypothetical protein